MTDKPQTDPRTVVLNNVRLSFTDSLKDKKATVEDGEPKHNCNFILEAGKPETEANKAKVMAAIRAACEQEWKKEDFWKTIQEDDPKRICYRKGERFKNKDGVVYEGYAGNMAISAAGPRGGRERPKLMDRLKRDVAYDDILAVCYSGSYGDVKLSFYGTTKGGNGIFCTIEGIRSRQEGDRIGGGGSPATKDDFDDLEDNSFDGGGKTPATADDDIG